MYLHIFTETKEKQLETMFDNLDKLKEILGKEVLVDYSLVPEDSYYKYPEAWNGEPFKSTVVGINKMNCSNNGWGGNNGELNIYPSFEGVNWGTIDLRMVKEIIK